MVSEVVWLCCCRSWSKQYLVYVYGTYLVLILEIITCQLFCELGAQDGQLRRPSMIRALMRAVWRKRARHGEGDDLLPVRITSCYCSWIINIYIHCKHRACS